MSKNHEVAVVTRKEAKVDVEWTNSLTTKKRWRCATNNKGSKKE
jgi:hypothetical protein